MAQIIKIIGNCFSALLRSFSGYWEWGIFSKKRCREGIFLTNELFRITRYIAETLAWGNHSSILRINSWAVSCQNYYYSVSLSSRIRLINKGCRETTSINKGRIMRVTGKDPQAFRPRRIRKKIICCVLFPLPGRSEQPAKSFRERGGEYAAMMLARGDLG